MAHQRQPSSANAPGGPHAVSLKVLRLSRPSLATQTPLPRTHFGNGLDISPQASLACTTSAAAAADGRAEATSSFPLTPLLTLPAAFGAAYVGETFTCTLCANNEVREGEKRSVSGIRVAAELQSPGNKAGEALDLHSAAGPVGGKDAEAREGDGAEEEEEEDLPPGGTMQRIVRHEMKEEGPHVLAVTVTYTETLRGEDGGASGGRVRNFRKLYSFVAEQLVAVRSKVTERKRREKGARRAWVLEAQLENVGEASVVLEKVWLTEHEGVVGKDVNGDVSAERIVLKPQDVEQVMFVLEERHETGSEEGARRPLAQLNVDWRGAMGERGNLTTGWLTSRVR